MTDAMNVFFNSKKTDSNEELHESVMEHVIASEYGWTLDYIRSLSYNDFQRHFWICYMKIDADFQKFKAIAQIQSTKGMI